VKAAARLCFACAMTMFSAAVVLDKGSAGMAAMIGLALLSFGLLLMTLR
jgi:hypothetical protein